MKKFILKQEEIKQLIPAKGSCIASDKITVEGMKVGYMYREVPNNEYDSGWRIFSGNEDEEYTNNSANFEIYDLNTICNYDNSIIPYLDYPQGSCLERNGNAFITVKNETKN